MAPSAFFGSVAYIYHPTDANAISLALGPLSKGASYIDKGLSDSLSNIGNLMGIYSIAEPKVKKNRG